MSQKWEDFVEGFRDQSGKLLKDELSKLILTTKEDANAFLQRQGEKLELYLNQLAEGLITKEQFEGYVKDIKDLTNMKSLQMTVAGKASAQRLVQGISELVIKGLMAMV